MGQRGRGRVGKLGAVGGGEVGAALPAAVAQPCHCAQCRSITPPLISWLGGLCAHSCGYQPPPPQQGCNGSRPGGRLGHGACLVQVERCGGSAIVVVAVDVQYLHIMMADVIHWSKHSPHWAPMRAVQRAHTRRCRALCPPPPLPNDRALLVHPSVTAGAPKTRLQTVNAEQPRDDALLQPRPQHDGVVGFVHPNALPTLSRLPCRWLSARFWSGRWAVTDSHAHVMLV